MNIFLEKNENSKVGKLVERLKTLIEGSVFQDHVYIVGGLIRDSLLNLPLKKRLSHSLLLLFRHHQLQLPL